MLAADVEREMFQLHGGVNRNNCAQFANFGVDSWICGCRSCCREYKKKLRTLKFNLTDPKNPELHARVVGGEVTPSNLVSLSEWEGLPPLCTMYVSSEKRCVQLLGEVASQACLTLLTSHESLKSLRRRSLRSDAPKSSSSLTSRRSSSLTTTSILRSSSARLTRFADTNHAEDDRKGERPMFQQRLCVLSAQGEEVIDTFLKFAKLDDEVNESEIGCAAWRCLVWQLWFVLALL